jgi:RNA polymerase sigma-70 factor (ECF subfamily)
VQLQLDNERLSDLIETVAARHDRGAFGELFKHFAPRLKAVASRQGVNPTTAEELTQEAMLSLWRKAGTFDRRKATASTWVFTILRNKRIDFLRRERRPELSVDDIPEVAADITSADDGYHQLQSSDMLRRAMAELPQEQVEVLQKAFFEDKSHSLIAEELDLPLGTVKSRIRLALTRMRIALPEAEI